MPLPKPPPLRAQPTETGTGLFARVWSRWFSALVQRQVEVEARLDELAVDVAINPDWNETDPDSLAYIENKPTGALLPDATASDTGRIAKVDADGNWVLGTDEVGSPGSGEENVQSDWDQADDTADNYIVNKPDLTLKADVESPTLTGIPRAPQPDMMTAPDDQIATVAWVKAYVPTVTPPTPTGVPTGFIGWSDDTTVTAADLTTPFDERRVLIPARTDPGGYLVFARTAAPYALYYEGETTQFSNPFNVLGGFTNVGTLDIGGVEHHVFRSNAQQDSSILGTGTYRIRFGG